jgi:hypothetical protein
MADEMHSGSILLMNRTVKSGSHPSRTKFYRWVLWKIIKKLIKRVPFRNALCLRGSKLLLHCSAPISQTNSRLKSGSHSNGTNFYKWVLWKIIKTYI